MAFRIDDKCIGCGACANNCPVTCISQKDSGQYEVNDLECIDCGTCQSVCPVEAVSQA